VVIDSYAQDAQLHVCRTSSISKSDSGMIVASAWSRAKTTPLMARRSDVTNVKRHCFVFQYSSTYARLTLSLHGLTKDTG